MGKAIFPMLFPRVIFLSLIETNNLDVAIFRQLSRFLERSLLRSHVVRETAKEPSDDAGE